jgi:hypothetical protein
MGTSANTTGVIMAESEARAYYRREGFGRLVIRTSPSVRRFDNLRQVSPEQLTEGDVEYFVVFPELILRSDPWRFMGKVVDISSLGVIVQHINDEEKSSKPASWTILLPQRYFADGRVHREML